MIEKNDRQDKGNSACVSEEKNIFKVTPKSEI